MGNNYIKKETVIKASDFFLTSNQIAKNKVIDKMFREQPSLLEYIYYLDQAIIKEPIKEVIIQLMSIFYYGITLQKIKLGKIPFSSLDTSLTSNIEMKNYFHNPDFNFDVESFKEFYEDYDQKEIINYTYFAINNQFRNYIETEQEGLFILYSMKAFGDAINLNIKD